MWHCGPRKVAASLIELKSGQRLSVVTVGRILKKLGMADINKIMCGLSDREAFEVVLESAPSHDEQRDGGALRGARVRVDHPTAGRTTGRGAARALRGRREGCGTGRPSG